MNKIRFSQDTAAEQEEKLSDLEELNSTQHTQNMGQVNVWVNPNWHLFKAPTGSTLRPRYSTGNDFQITVMTIAPSDPQLTWVSRIWVHARRKSVPDSAGWSLTFLVSTFRALLYWQHFSCLLSWVIITWVTVLSNLPVHGAGKHSRCCATLHIVCRRMGDEWRFSCMSSLQWLTYATPLVPLI